MIGNEFQFLQIFSFEIFFRIIEILIILSQVFFKGNSYTMRYLLFGCILLVALSVNGQDSDFIRLKGKLPISKRLILVDSVQWKLNTKGLKSVKLSFNDGDTIVYIITKDRKRTAEFLLFDSNPNPVIQDKFKTNIISGGFVANGLGTYLFEIKNRSFFGNNFSLEIKKINYKPPIDTIPKIIVDSIFRYDTVYTYVLDSIITQIDSTTYLASTLNINESSEYVVPFSLKKENHYYSVLKPKALNVRTSLIDEKSAKLNKTTSSASGKEKEKIIIYTTILKPPVKIPFSDTIKVTALKDVIKSGFDKIEKDQQMPAILPNEKLYVQNFVITNSEKVPGKHVNIQVKEILILPKYFLQKFFVKIEVRYVK